MKFSRVVLIVLDGVGIGALPDAADYGDAGTNTLQHVAAAVDSFELPMFSRLGLGHLLDMEGVPAVEHPIGSWAKLREVSVGKDSITGHWELLGARQVEPFRTFPEGFPAEVIAEWRSVTGQDPLGNVAASGTEIIQQLGAEHLRTARPIVYTSADSVFQVAAHEDVVPVEDLYAICRRMRQRLDRWRIGRVIARPFTGSAEDGFVRTSRRHDFSMQPPSRTALDVLLDNGVAVHGVGKVGNLFAGQGFSHQWSTVNNRDGMHRIDQLVRQLERGLIFANLIDFDMLWGHRRDVEGFANGMRQVDRWLERLLPALRRDDLLLITADHGCDPTASGTDHTREYVPLLVFGGQSIAAGVDLGEKAGLGVVASTITDAFGVNWQGEGSLLPSLLEKGETAR
ncbi:MAG: phosphopentomutase [Desulfuromonas sp.]|nr:MAG: phosphopentomutase [Desulfuromonas sp.]